MAKIYTTRKYKPHVLQALSALIIITAIIVSYSSILMIFKALIYLICFMLDFKIIEMSIKGYRVEIQLSDWVNKVNQRTVSRIYNEVKNFVIDNQKASESLIERNFKVNYQVATSIIERLEKEGVVGPGNEKSSREVLVAKEQK